MKQQLGVPVGDISKYFFVFIQDDKIVSDRHLLIIEFQ